jgi:hypothetical protein
MPITEKPDNTIAWITVRAGADGALSISGTLSPRSTAIAMLDHARDAVRRQVPDDRAIVIPNRDVVVPLGPHLRDVGDMAPTDRGDP